MTGRSLQLHPPLLLLGLLLPLAGGCSQTIYSPARPAEPVKVFVTDYGFHSSVLLPVAERRYVEYSFGDWGYAAENRMWPHDTFAALTISFQSAIGRRYIDIKPGDRVPRPKEWRPRHWVVFYVERARVNKVLRELEDRYQVHASTGVYNSLNETMYVKDPERYSWTNNCNHMTVRLLKQLGCDVKGFVVTSVFRLGRTRQQVTNPAKGMDGAPVLAGRRVERPATNPAPQRPINAPSRSKSQSISRLP